MNENKNYPVVEDPGFFSKSLIPVLIFFIAAVILFGLSFLRGDENPSTAAADEIIETEKSTEQSRMIVNFLDIGEGDSILIQSPSGKNILIDGGMGSSEYSHFDAGENVIVPMLHNRNIEVLDIVISTHQHFDHIGGLISVLRSFPVKKYIDNKFAFGTESYAELLQIVKEKNIPYEKGVAGDIIDIDPNIWIQILHPVEDSYFKGTRSDANNNSIVMKLIYHKIDFLLTGDVETVAEQTLLEYGQALKSFFLKVPHHGSETSTSSLFLKTVDPKVAIIPSGEGNRHGHPDSVVVNRLRDYGVKIYRTDYHGTISVITDGFGYKIITEK